MISALRGQRPRPLDERATRTPRATTEATTNHLTKYRAFRPFLLPALLAVLAGCAELDRAFAPALRPWPLTADGRLHREERILRASGSSVKSREEADAEASKVLERWLGTLDIPLELPEKRAVIRAVMEDARPVPSPVPQATGYTSLIHLDLPTLQKRLGTHYD